MSEAFDRFQQSETEYGLQTEVVTYEERKEIFNAGRKYQADVDAEVVANIPACSHPQYYERAIRTAAKSIGEDNERSV